MATISVTHPPAGATNEPEWNLPVATPGQFTATWDGTTLVNSVTSGGAVFASFSGQCCQKLAGAPSAFTRGHLA